MSEPTSTTTAIVGDYFRLFVNRVDCYLGWRDGWRTVRRPLTPALIGQALEEPIPLGVYAVSGIGTSRWTCFDADDDEAIPRLIDLASKLPAESRLCETSRRGGHVWLFHSPLPWQSAREFGMELATRHGLDGIEIFPKHGGLNGVRLPGLIHPKTGKRSVVIDLDEGEAKRVAEMLPGLRPLQLGQHEPSSQAEPRPPNTSGNDNHFNELFAALAGLTTVEPIGPNRARGLCPWHDDHAPSLYLKDRRFHCLACGVFGDIWDVRRWTKSGIQPPGAQPVRSTVLRD